MNQTTSTIVMIRPARFGSNAETLGSNAFQRAADAAESAGIQSKALAEFDAFVALLRKHGVAVHVSEDTPEPLKPDAIFPNNWISFHAGGNAVLYPMYSTSRRHERRSDLITGWQEKFGVHTVTDLSGAEAESRFLEGTGSIVIDRVHGIAFACRSGRTDEQLFRDWAAARGYRPFVFDACDRTGKPIYHTNVLMGIGEEFAVVCLEAIPDASQRQALIEEFENTPHTIIPITLEQLYDFAGNLLQVRNSNNDQLVVMSQRAWNALGEMQRKRLLVHGTILTPDLTTIETYGGGSARCMLAEVFA